MESLAEVFFSHPDESNIVEKIIATNVEQSAVFIGLTRHQVSNRGRERAWLPNEVTSYSKLEQGAARGSLHRLHEKGFKLKSGMANGIALPCGLGDGPGFDPMFAAFWKRLDA